jgi:hypothetical protein
MGYATSFIVVICLPLHVHNHVENVLKYVLFYVHNSKVIVEKIGLSIRKFSQNTSLDIDRYDPDSLLSHP